MQLLSLPRPTSLALAMMAAHLAGTLSPVVGLPNPAPAAATPEVRVDDGCHRADNGLAARGPAVTDAAVLLEDSVEKAAPSPPTTMEAPSSTNTFTELCDIRYCQDGLDICIYWAGYTSWDVSRGPMPGEVPTVLGPCTDR